MYMLHVCVYMYIYIYMYIYDNNNEGLSTTSPSAGPPAEPGPFGTGLFMV